MRNNSYGFPCSDVGLPGEGETLLDIVFESRHRDAEDRHEGDRALQSDQGLIIPLSIDYPDNMNFFLFVINGI